MLQPQMVTTYAFGFDLNKPDIRNIVHFYLPPTVEDFSQHIGLAGRDGKPAFCLAFLCVQDFNNREGRVRKEFPSLPAIEKLLHQVMIVENANTPVGQVFSVSHRQMSKEYDIIPYAMEMIYAILEMRFNLIQVTTSEFAEYKYVPSPEYLEEMQNDETKLGKAIREFSKLEDTWYHINVNDAAKQAGLPREAVVDRLDHLKVKGKIELARSRHQHRYQVMSPLPKDRTAIAKLAKQVFDLMETFECDALKRCQQVIDLLTDNACTSRLLAEHFDMSLPDGKKYCGHCGFCEMRPAMKPWRPHKVLNKVKIAKLLATVQDRDDPRFLANFGFGIATPRIAEKQYHYHPLFGSLAGQDFKVSFFCCLSTLKAESRTAAALLFAC